MESIILKIMIFNQTIYLKLNFSQKNNQINTNINLYPQNNNIYDVQPKGNYYFPPEILIHIKNLILGYALNTNYDNYQEYVPKNTDNTSYFRLIIILKSQLKQMIINFL